MRVISGRKKGYGLKAPKGRQTRPTEDRIKESLFNILMDIHDESIVLDLFAGSGSIGIEFLSRGAKKSFFVDRSYDSIKCIKENLQHTDLSDIAEVFKTDAIKSIMLFADKDIKFDYIFADPPYGQDLIIKTIKKISKENILKENGLLILEHEKNLVLEDKIDSLKKTDCREYGSKNLTFFTKDKLI